MKRGLNVRQTCGALSFYQNMVYMLYEYRTCNPTNNLMYFKDSYDLQTVNKILFLNTKNSKSLFELVVYLLLNNVCEIDKTIQSVVVFNKSIFFVANLKNVI